ncbi:winged helix-turn-helix domain-containing protein [Thermoproteus tenax]|uniref:Transcriptional regulator containing HTH domain, ArsR family n=1 Tax=Thermoproteus tenax (strain ATCC 35583 / DSM 2078 / JCM 9277 / NBRC 100435 / Kra 1) TaxID=768679 RepID=G4RN35_THETK|nr:winged helix-turn-helix domain-containing protein [Thermoproteus tenax]CCC80979.1 transcriptional regulator containing HTH domain, ArsR family [Thermoproteus tenax Kra 1]
MDKIKSEILALLQREGPLPVYRIAKELGLSYGAAQWHIFSLEKQGLVKTYRMGNKRYAALNSNDLLRVYRVGDVLRDLELMLLAYGIKEDFTVEEALERLRSKRMAHIAQIIEEIARERIKREEERKRGAESSQGE